MYNIDKYNFWVLYNNINNEILDIIKGFWLC